LYHLNQIREIIAGAGLKATHQRLVILESVIKNHSHPNVDQIYNAIQVDNPSISKGTVYKTLETLANSGLLSKVSSIDGHMRYDPRIDNHGHIYCANTKEIIDYYDEDLNELIIAFFKKKKVNNLKIKNITLQINGDKINLEKEVVIK
jgi:Fur family peroxide stress response transcriptional regulator